MTFKCEKCNDTGNIYFEKSIILMGEKRSVMVYDKCDCAEGKKSIEKIEDKIDEVEILKNNICNCFGEMYLPCTYDNFIGEKTFIESIKKLVHDKTWLYLYGESRSGKTHMATAIYKDIIAVNKKIYAINSVELDLIISDYNDENRRERLEFIKCVNVLIIDDIGVAKLTQERHLWYYNIINYRLSNFKKTIFTSNCKTSELWQGTTDIDAIRLQTRIYEGSEGFHFVKVKR